MPQLAANIWADGPYTDPYTPPKNDIRDWGTPVESIINAFTSNGGLLYTSRASLYADLAHAASAMAWVLGDATAAYNGVYVKIGTSGTGSWTRVGDLPYSFIIASDVGAGTPNAIQATTSIPVSGSALVILSVFEANTGSPVTVSFNGTTPVTIKTNTGNDVAGGLAAGMQLLGYKSGATFRALNDQVSSAIVAAAEAAEVGAQAAQVAAEAAAAGVSLPPVAANRMLVDNATGTSRDSKTFPQVRALLSVPVTVETLAAAQAIDPTNERALIMRDGTRDGLFFWDGNDLSSQIIHNTVTTTTVQPSTDNCILTAHGFMTGNAVYTATAVNGLSANTIYYVIRIDASNFKLATSIANAFAGTAVDLTGSTNITLKRHSDPLAAVFIIPTGLAVDGSQGAFVRDGFELTPQMFGAKADYAVTNTNDHDAIQAWFQTLLCLDDFGYSGMLRGRYYLARDLILQPTELTNETRGIAIRAATRNHDGFYFQNGFRFEMSNPNGAPLFYITFQAKIAGNVNNSQMVTFGMGDFSDAFNSCALDLIVNNAGTGTTKALTVNGMYESDIKAVVGGRASGKPVSMGGVGPTSEVGVWLRQTQFSRISLASGNTGTALLLDGGYCYGNTFDGSLDIEEVDVGIQIAGANCYDNKFLGGTMVATKTFNCTDGINNKADGVTISAGYTGWQLFAPGGERMRVRSRALPGLSLAINPGSGSLYRNTSGRKIGVRIEGSLTALDVNKADGNTYPMGALGAGFPVYIELDAYDGFTPTYTGTPTFSYYPLD